ncbi:hypothetical protein SUGI_0888230 [Cryptomeria japonica]|nr:hypothetical protein SUGI_0888230 [Cryptomeria japonica]
MPYNLAGVPDSICNMGGWAIVGVFIGNTLCFVAGIGNEHERTSVNELCHYLLLPVLFVAFAYNRKQPPVFGASPYFLCTLLSLPGPSFHHTPSNFPNYNVFTNSNANAPLLYQIPGTWSNHEGSVDTQNCPI